MSVPIFAELQNHQVYRNTEGAVVPSITTILSIINKPELVGWANWLGFKKRTVKSELDSSALIGTFAHNLIEEYTRSHTYSFEHMRHTPPAESICVKNAFASFLQFYNTVRDEWVFEERELQMSGEKFGGTLDNLTTFYGKRTIGDYKTSKAFYPSMFLQIAGYDLLLRETRDIKAEQYMVILLDKRNARQASVKICDDKDEMRMYRKAFKELVEFYYSWYHINQAYWGKDIIKKEDFTESMYL